MTDTEINLAIARECGWKPIESPTFVPEQLRYWWKDGELRQQRCLPAYEFSLDSMHEAEEYLSPEEQEAYNAIIRLVVPKYMWRVTGREKARAFLVAKGKWTGQ